MEGGDNKESIQKKEAENEENSHFKVAG